MSQLTTIYKYFKDADFTSWNKGEYICHEGGPMSRLYYLKSGRCRIFRNLNSGQTILYRIYIPGSVLGDIELFTGMEASCSVQCISSVETLSIRMDLLRGNVTNFSEMLFQLSSGLARKMHENSVNDSINTAYSLEVRLAHYYLTFTDPGLTADNLGQLSAWMGCSYRHLTRSQAHLLQIGAIKKSTSGYSASSIDTLEEIAAPLLDEEQGRGLFEQGD